MKYRDRFVSMNERVSSMVKSGKTKDDILGRRFFPHAEKGIGRRSGQ